MSEANALDSLGLLIQIFTGALGSAAPGSSPSASMIARYASCCSGVHWSWGISAKRPTVGCACDTSVFPVFCDLPCSGNVVFCFIGLSFCDDRRVQNRMIEISRRCEDFCVHSTAQLNDHLSVCCPRDLQQSRLLRILNSVKSVAHRL